MPYIANTSRWKKYKIGIMEIMRLCPLNHEQACRLDDAGELAEMIKRAQKREAIKANKKKRSKNSIK